MAAHDSENPDQRRGLYRPSDEHDSCGVGFVAHIKGQRSHDIVRQALQLLINLEHRGACGSDPNTGDGAGILIQMPDAFLRRSLPFSLPPAGSYGAGLVFLPVEKDARAAIRAFVERIVAEEGQRVLGWRPVPTSPASIGVGAATVAPVFEQIFVGTGDSPHLPDGSTHVGTVPRFERKLYVIRKRIERELAGLKLPDAARKAFYVVSL